MNTTKSQAPKCRRYTLSTMSNKPRYLDDVVKNRTLLCTSTYSCKYPSQPIIAYVDHFRCVCCGALLPKYRATTAGKYKTQLAPNSHMIKPLFLVSLDVFLVFTTIVTATFNSDSCIFTLNAQRSSVLGRCPFTCPSLPNFPTNRLLVVQCSSLQSLVLARVKVILERSCQLDSVGLAILSGLHLPSIRLVILGGKSKEGKRDLHLVF